jgi:hypothetical protein
MARLKRRVLIIEAIPKNEKHDEAAVLQNFFDMVFDQDRERVVSYRVHYKQQIMSYLRRKQDLGTFAFVHISAHGEPDEGSIRLPNGWISPLELQPNCFKGKTVTFSACSMGGKAFAAEVIEHTGAENVIGPRNEVLFPDAALWFVNFYYLVLAKRYTPMKAHARVNRMLADKVKGGFQFYNRREIANLNGK